MPGQPFEIEQVLGAGGPPAVSPLAGSSVANSSAPPGLRLALYALLALFVGGGLYLAVVRGDALLVDMAHLAQMIFCF